MTKWTPETNRIPTGLLTAEERAALEAAEHGWEWYSEGKWKETVVPAWVVDIAYRAKPAPPKRVVAWHNVYAEYVAGGDESRRGADLSAADDRLCVYRIERNEDGSNPQIFVDDVK
jgi:hypothetical protein